MAELEPDSHLHDSAPPGCGCTGFVAPGEPGVLLALGFGGESYGESHASHAQGSRRLYTALEQFVTVPPVLDDINQNNDDDIEPIDGGVELEKPSKFVSPFTRAENRYSKGRPINDAQMKERINAAYMLMLQGGSRRENACQLSTRYGVSFRQAENYLAEAKKLMKEDFAGERAEFLNQVNNMRMHTVKKALKRGNFQVVAQLLDSLGRAMGEGSVEEAANQAPTLNITVEDRRNKD